ncbi:TPA: hypothetical protein ACV8DF_003648 [Escherichia coli]
MQTGLSQRRYRAEWGKSTLEKLCNFVRFCAVLILRFFVAGGDDIHLSESVGDCRVRTMKNYSYPYLTFVTLSVLGGDFSFYLVAKRCLQNYLPLFVHDKLPCFSVCGAFGFCLTVPVEKEPG